MKVALVFLGLLALATATETVSYRGYKAYEAQVETESQGRFLLAVGKRITIDFWTPVRIGKSSTMMVAPRYEEIFTSALDSAKIQYSVMSDDVQKLVDKMPKMKLHKDTPDGYHSMDWSDYHDLATMYEYLDYLEDIPDYSLTTETIGQSYEGTDLRIAKICRGGCGNKPAMYIEGGIHSREWMSPAVVTYFIRELTENGANNDDLLENLDWYILPVTNPDGYAYTQVDRMWRKTRSPNSGSPCIGTDANRNWDQAWGEEGASGNPCSDTFYGSGPFSEPETAAVSNFLLSIQSNLKFLNDVHSAANMVLLPWGYQYQHTPDYDQQLEFFNRAADALFAVHGEVYDVGAIPDLLYVASGSSVDFSYGTLGVKYSTSVELRDDYSFFGPPETIILECEEMWAFHQQAARDIIAEYVP